MPASLEDKKPSPISVERMEVLNLGQEEARTLAECLAVDFPKLAASSVKQASQLTLRAITDARGLGIVKRMEVAGSALLSDLGAAGIDVLAKHRSDTVRGWACFVIGAQADTDLASRLNAIMPLADDPHFGVREWAWLAVRGHLVRELPAAIKMLSTWTHEPSPFVRRFASEAIRPRGVWCSHIAALKESPSIALPILEPLKTDPAAYVQDSVANWLNDASKDQPEWVRDLCVRWQRDNASAATKRICTRAQRTLQKNSARI